ncbi:hypothetical protein VVMO6_01502 [Vibrio vulnificus MO6-24/O]|nr:hypothetical protein VVMO6_01502 [Vibrio vulnificus MO6-24/O]
MLVRKYVEREIQQGAFQQVSLWQIISIQLNMRDLFCWQSGL